MEKKPKESNAKREALQEIMDMIKGKLETEMMGEGPKAVEIEMTSLKPKKAKALKPEEAMKILEGEEEFDEIPELETEEEECEECGKTPCECEVE